jgi:hypothetical protein
MIAALLRLPMIKKIVGGGHASHMNFNLNDLPPEEKEALLKERPELGNAFHYLKTKGYDSKFEDMLLTEITNEFGHGKTVWDVGKEYVVINQWDDLTRLINSYDVYIDSDWAIQPIFDMASGDFDAIEMDGITDLSVSIAEKDEYAEARKSISNAGQNVKQFMHDRADDIDMMRHAICKRVEKNCEDYGLRWINLLPFDVSAMAFVKTEEGKIEARIDTYTLAKSLDMNTHPVDDEWGDFDHESLMLTNVRSEGWFHYDAYEAKQMLDSGSVEYNLKTSPELLIGKLRKVSAKLMTRAIHKYLK